MKSTNLAGLACSAVLMGALSACGGGGSGYGGSGSAPSTYDIDTIVTKFEQTSQSYDLMATSGANTYSLQISSVPGSSAAFDGITADTATSTVTFFTNGTLTSTDISTLFYLTSPYESIGGIDATSGEVAVYSGQRVLPIAAKVGDSGTADTQTVYTDSSLTTVIGTITDTWTLSAGTGNDAILCLDSKGTNASGPFTETDCYTIDPAGDALALIITLTESGQTLVFQ